MKGMPVEKQEDGIYYIMSIVVQANKEKFQDVPGMICEPLKEILMEQMKDELEEKMEQRLQQELQQGMQQAIQKGIQVLIETCREVSLTYEQTTNKIVSKYALSSEEASAYMQKYW